MLKQPMRTLALLCIASALCAMAALGQVQNHHVEADFERYERNSFWDVVSTSVDTVQEVKAGQTPSESTEKLLDLDELTKDLEPLVEKQERLFHDANHDVDPLESYRLMIDPKNLMTEEEVTQSFFSQDSNLKNQLLNARWSPFRVRFVYTPLNDINDGGRTKNFIKTELLEPIRAWFGRLLEVKRNPRGVQTHNNLRKCFHVDVTRFNGLGGGRGGVSDSNHDMVIFVTAKNEPQSTAIAYAGACMLDSGNLRPNVGMVNFNLKYLKITQDKTALYKQVSTSMHELTHALGFSSNLFFYFVNSGLNKVGANNVVTRNAYAAHSSSNMIISPRVVQLGKKYFNCNNLRGIPLENQGGSGTAGSHWERAVLGNEAMTGSEIADARYSMFTLAFLEDSGWYKPNYNLADQLEWGYGEGCGFIGQGYRPGCRGSNSFREFCEKGRVGDKCDKWGTFQQYCKKGQLSDDCAYWSDYSNGGVADPNQKRCFQIKLNGAIKTFKLPFSCSSDRRSVTAIFYKKRITCSRNKEQKQVRGFTQSVTMICPDNIAGGYCGASSGYDTNAEKIVAGDLGQSTRPTYPRQPKSTSHSGNYKNDDKCLTSDSSWSNYRCGMAKEYCTSTWYKKHVTKCCPCTCNPTLKGCSIQNTRARRLHDSKTCLHSASSWKSYTCATTKSYCNSLHPSWRNHAQKCCPCTCNPNQAGCR